MSDIMKTLTIGGTTYSIVDETARTAAGTLFSDGETFQQKYDNGELTGPAGPAGEKGSDGAQGEQGPQGEKGADGAQGEQGPQGEKGEKGDTGATGATGATGPAGEKGADGYTPVKGTDYFTESDKEEIIDAVLVTLPFGEDNSFGSTGTTEELQSAMEVDF